MLAVTRRTKEIGIRNLLGAGAADITARLSPDLLKPVLIAVAIASPLGWYCMHRWLQGFAYRIHLQWWLFLVAALLTALIALLTIGMQALRATTANPLASLKTE